jgi:uncharacterized membrane protein
MGVSNTKKINPLRRWYGSRLAVILESIIIGFVVGFVIVLFPMLYQVINIPS